MMMIIMMTLKIKNVRTPSDSCTYWFQTTMQLVHSILDTKSHDTAKSSGLIQTDEDEEGPRAGRGMTGGSHVRYVTWPRREKKETKNGTWCKECEPDVENNRIIQITSSQHVSSRRAVHSVKVHSCEQGKKRTHLAFPVGGLTLPVCRLWLAFPVCRLWLTSPVGGLAFPVCRLAFPVGGLWLSLPVCTLPISRLRCKE